jgi:hypothetical protein
MQYPSECFGEEIFSGERPNDDVSFDSYNRGLTMGVVDLSVRLTTDWDWYHKNVYSSDSAIYISPLPPLDDGPASVDLRVGDRCYRQNEDRYFQIVDDGVPIAAYQSLLVETAKDDDALPVSYLLSLTQRAQLWLRRHREYLSIVVPILALAASIAAVLVNIWIRKR